MKTPLLALFVVSFLAIAVFGVFCMHIGAQNHSGGCIAAKLQGFDCRQQSDPIGYLTFHLNAFKDLSAAILGWLAVDSLIFFLISLILLVLLGNFARFKFNSACHKLKQLKSLLSLFQHEFLHWLAIHENSPSAL